MRQKNVDKFCSTFKQEPKACVVLLLFFLLSELQKHFFKRKATDDGAEL